MYLTVALYGFLVFYVIIGCVCVREIGMSSEKN